jgi:hypothetical protein
LRAVIITLVLVSVVAAQEKQQARRSGTANVSESKTATGTATTAVQAGTATMKATSGCVGAVTVRGTGGTRGLAEETARVRWQDQVATNFGNEYETWKNSKNQTTACSRAGFGSWFCDLTGEPCTAGAGGVSTPTPGGPECFDHLTVTGGDAALQSVAENRARKEWQRVAGITYSDAYRAWIKAKEPSLFCKHNGLGAGQRRWECTASAKPCK